MRASYFILFVLIFSCQGDENAKSELSFQNDIGPIFWKNCSSCHQANGAGPFDLISYDDINKKKHTILEVIESGYMPPWPADTLSNTFLGEKKLSQGEIKRIRNWIEGGAPENKIKNYSPDYKLLTNVPKPDLIFKLPKVEIQGNNKDEFYLMKIPFELEENKIIKLAILKPGNPKLVHHCDAQLINYKPDKKENIEEGLDLVNVNDYASYQEAFTAMNLLNDNGSYPELSPGLMHFLPGSEWQIYPSEIGGFEMNKTGAFLINQMHYGPSAIKSSDQSELHIYLTEETPKRKVKELVLGSGGKGKIKPELIIPPNKKSSFELNYTVKDTMSILTINPHMHQLGNFFEASIISHNEKEKVMVKITNWDFRWQNFYTYQYPLIAYPGDRIKVSGIYDNTQENPFNPNSPPLMVDGLKNSMKSSDEMFQFSLNYLEYQKGDELIPLSTK
ncbi:MAG: cytochrome c [Bacteroidota bacterium]